MSERIRILNVDDTESLRYGKSRILKQAGFEVIEAGTAADALRLLREWPLQLVLLDVKLPDMNGIDVCRKIKQDPALRAIPVVQISATFVTEQDREAGLQGGADVYLTEPVEPQELITVVNMLLRLRSTEAGLRETLERERAARTQAEEATRLKDEFLANLSHELRTPMNIIMGWSHLLRTGALSPEQTQRAVSAIDRAARSQAQLIEDLLDVSRIVAGNFRLTKRRAVLDPIVEAAVESLRPAAQSRGVTLRLTHAATRPEVLGDPERLQQVVWNLVSNAVKFTDAQGNVEVTLGVDASHARIEVCDSGVGIASDFLPFVFDRFRQADGTSTREHMGMGLGLAIVRHVIELHGGSVQAHSAGVGQGSTFRVLLPLAHIGDTPREPPLLAAGAVLEGSADIGGAKVLLVDDDSAARDVTATALAQVGCELRVAGSAREALEVLEQWLPDIIVSDIGMPETDGYEFLRRLRERTTEQGGLVPALALTAFARIEDTRRALASGYQGHLAKPVGPRELAETIAGIIRRHPRPARS